MHKIILCLIAITSALNSVVAQNKLGESAAAYLIHSSGNHLERGSDGGGWIEAPDKANPQQLTFIADGKGYYSIEAPTGQFLSLDGQWNTKFIADSAQATAKFSIETTATQFIRLRCKANNKYLGTDSNAAHQKVYADKDGNDNKHHWFLADNVNEPIPQDTTYYLLNPLILRQHFDGWGVSLCWWAGQCGKWSDKKIDEIITWLVSPTGLNYSHFRYNIGGGDDPQNTHCDPHHMGKGKGLRAEMEGFKDFSDDEYHWERDAAQRKIMLKIKEKRPDAVFEAFSNSCPYYMTYSGCVGGNADGGKDNLRPEYYVEFAQYLVDVCKHYKDQYDIEFKTLEPFNESASNYWSANGSQEGCHFDYASQIAFLHILEPILRKSGLNTVISASDETNVGVSVQGFQAYQNAGALPLVDQWNTHTYSASNTDRARLAFLAHQEGIPLWMSETGSGGSGIAGNLSLAQRLIDDMRYMQPEAWIDWQYMEEGNDQWCTIRGSFANQTYSKVKNYYVRQQCSRFIKHGYDIITSPCPQTLAAVNAERDTLVLVALNEGAATVHQIDLSLLEDIPVRSQMKAYRTSDKENLTNAISSVKLNDNMLTLHLPAQSITTLVIPARSLPAEPEDLLCEDVEYLIIPRLETTRAITATGSKVTIQDIDYGEAQRWTLTDEGDGTYGLQNALGLRLTAHRASSSSSLTAQENTASEQGFYIDVVDYPYFKILASRGRTHGFDLTSASSSQGTTVGIWQYQDNTIPTHRQWMLFPLNRKTATGIIPPLAPHQSSFINPQSSSPNWTDLSGRQIVHPSARQLPSGIYIVNGKKKYLKKQ